jgi:hypothetical protein
MERKKRKLFGTLNKKINLQNPKISNSQNRIRTKEAQRANWN